MDKQNPAHRKPIGYWLKHLDTLLTSQIDQIQADNGFTRFRWQVLNLLFEAGTVKRLDIIATMKDFINANEVDDILSKFLKEGWVAREGTGDAAMLTITEAGKALRETIFQRQSEVRTRLMQGISAEEYATVVSILQRMAENLE